MLVDHNVVSVAKTDDKEMCDNVRYIHFIHKHTKHNMFVYPVYIPNTSITSRQYLLPRILAEVVDILTSRIPEYQGKFEGTGISNINIPAEFGDGDWCLGKPDLSRTLVNQLRTCEWSKYIALGIENITINFMDVLKRPSGTLKDLLNPQ